MHKLLLLLFAMLPDLTAQTPAAATPPATNLEQFLARKESLIEKIAISLGSVRTSHPRREEYLTLEGIIARDFAGRGTSAKGVQVLVPSGQRFYVDENELDHLVRAYQSMEGLAQDSDKNLQGTTRVLWYETKSGLNTSFYPGSGGGSVGGTGVTYSPMSAASLGEMRRLLEQAKSWLLAH